jgi:hypothetical protein
MRPLYLLLAAGLVIGSFTPLAAYAKSADPDGPTQSAITALRAGAASLASSYGKAANSAQILSSYDDKLTGLSAKQFNTVMVVETRAELATMNTMDPTSRNLIKTYWATQSSH